RGGLQTEEAIAMPRLHALCPCLLFALVPPAAAAPPELAGPAPGAFLTLDRVGETSAMGMGASLVGDFLGPSIIDQAVPVDAFGRWRGGSGGVYGQMSWSHTWWRDHSIPGTSATLIDFTAASDLELGGTYALAVPGGELSLRGAVVLPTASKLTFAANI